MKIRSVVLAAGCAWLAGCSTDPEADFKQGRSLDACNENVPVCTTVASCLLDGTNYVTGTFSAGPPQRFIVRTDGAATVSLEIFFASEGSPGVNTEITWYESACSASATDSSVGTDVFAAAGPERVWSRSHQFTSAGDHLVELASDAQANYLLRISVL